MKLYTSLNREIDYAKDSFTLNKVVMFAQMNTKKKEPICIHFTAKEFKDAMKYCYKEKKRAKK